MRRRLGNAPWQRCGQEAVEIGGMVSWKRAVNGPGDPGNSKKETVIHGCNRVPNRQGAS